MVDPTECGTCPARKVWGTRSGAWLCPFCDWTDHARQHRAKQIAAAKARHGGQSDRARVAANRRRLLGKQR